MIKKGFHVHTFTGAIYFVHGISRDFSKEGPQGEPLIEDYVIYESTQGCGDFFIGSTWCPSSHVDPLNEAMRHRTAKEWEERIDPMTGEPDVGGVPRFQRIVGWYEGRPVVTDPDGRDGQCWVFTPKQTPVALDALLNAPDDTAEEE